MNKENNGFAIIIAPFNGDKPISLNVPFTLIKVALVVLICLVVTLFVGAKNIIEYKAFAKDYEEVLAENQNLQDQVLEFAAITERLREQVRNMESFDNSIRDMLEIENESSSSTESPQAANVTSDQLIAPSEQLMAVDPNRYILSGRSTLTRTLSELEVNLGILENQVPVQNDSLENLEEEVVIYTKTLAATPDIWPVRGHITSYFGYRRSPFGTGRDFHNGVDIAASYSTPVKATAPGVIILAKYSYGYGYHVIIDHGMGFKTLYAHLRRFKVKVGESVDKGQVIALSGNSGTSTGPHLHYEVRVNNVRRNPVNYLPK